jgi:hypothetical protein
MRTRGLVLILCLIAVFAVMPVIVPSLTVLGEPVAQTHAFVEVAPPAARTLAFAGDLFFRGPPVA